MASKHADDRLLAAAEEAAGGAFHLFWGGSLATVLSAVCAILIARLLGPEQYGIYSLALIVPGFLMLFTDYGVSQALTRFIALYMSRNEQHRVIPLLRKGLALNLATCFIMFLAGLILAEPLTNLLVNRPGMAHLVRIALILVLIYPLSTAAGYALLGFGDMKGYAMIDVVRQAARAILSPLMIVLGFSVAGAVAGYVIAFAFGLAVGLTQTYRRCRRIKNSKGSSGNVLHSMIAYGMPLYLSNTLNSFVTTLRGIILAYFTTNVLIGNFNTAMNFAVLITLVSSPVATALFPAFSKLGSSEAHAMFTHSVKYTAALIIPSAVFVSAMSRDLIFLLYGVSYSHAPLYLTLYAVTFLFAALGSTVLGSFFSGVGDSKVNLKATLFAVGIFVPSAAALTSILQVEGLLIAIILATAASTLYSLMVATCRYSLKIDLKSSAGICLAAVVAAAPIAPLALYSPLPRIANLAAAAVLYLIAYLTAVPLLRIITREDLETLTRIFSKVAMLQPIVRIISSYENKILGLINSEK
ncbi:MAG: oligosaccharide flippase family protein [Nitrososphaerota archaeon]|nr:oligosaccharide flippase family protein [Candidatus Bathyarchaeota archaeon]MDW8194097.1 oligosaccharide flippase family protein [Nitrososphaerota archaeon]